MWMAGWVCVGLRVGVGVALVVVVVVEEEGVRRS